MRVSWPICLSLVLLIGASGCSDKRKSAPDAGPPYDDPSDEFYDPDMVQAIELEITVADQQAMLDALPERIYVPATFRWNDVELEQIGVRYKGNSSSSPAQIHKRGFLMKFDEYVGGQEFLGLERASLDNGVQFGSLFSERILTDALRDLGVTTIRTNYATLRINGEYMGVYVNVERIDGHYLDRNFAGPDGPLYKVDEGGPGADLSYLGDDTTLYETAFEAKSDAAEDRTELVAFIGQLNNVTDDDFSAWLDSHWDLGPFVPTMAVLLLGGAFDQYTGWNAHNYYLYKDPSAGKWTYLAWDLDVGFADNAFDVVPVLGGWNAAYPYPVAPRPLLERMLAEPTIKADYRAQAAAILESHFHPDVIVPQLEGLYAQIADDLEDDPFPPGRITVPTDTDWQSVIDSLSAFMVARYDMAVAELADPQDTPPDPPDDTIPEPGDPSPDDPTDLVVTETSASHVALAWTNNLTGDGVVILQRCGGSGCTDFAPHIGQPLPAETAVDSDVTAGATYRYRVYSVYPGSSGPVATGPSNAVEATAID